MHIFNPQPEPAPDPGIYAVGNLLSEETWKAVDIATGGRVPAAPLLYAPDEELSWGEWVRNRFGPEFAARFLAARDAAGRGTLELATQDQSFAERIPAARQPGSTAFGLALLEASRGARAMPEMDKLHRLVTEGRCPGHAMTVLALRSVLFGITTVNGFVACLFCEWAGARAVLPAPLPSRDLLQRAFAAESTSLSPQIAAWLQAAGNNAFQSGSRR